MYKLQKAFFSTSFAKALFPLSCLNSIFSFHCLEVVCKDPELLVLSVNCITQTRVSMSDGAAALMVSTAALCSLHRSLLPGVEKEEEEEEKTVCHRRVSAKEETVRKSGRASYTT